MHLYTGPQPVRRSGNATTSTTTSSGYNPSSVYLVGSRKTRFGASWLYFLTYKTLAYLVFRAFGPLITLIVLNTKLIRALHAVRRKRAAMKVTCVYMYACVCACVCSQEETCSYEGHMCVYVCVCLCVCVVRGNEQL